MTFLKLLGKIILEAVGVVTAFAPAVEQTVPGSTGIVTTVSKDLSQLYQIVSEVEAIGQLQGMAGADKAKAAAPLIAQIILASAGMSGKLIANTALFNQGCVEIAGGIADVLNSVNGVVTSVSMTLPPVAGS